MASCPHISQLTLSPPTATQPVYREDCTICFDSIDDPNGLDVCLSCFNGGCAGDRMHGRVHSAQRDHPLALNIRRTKKPKTDRDEPPAKVTKLAIAAETEADIYDTKTFVRCYTCEAEDVEQTGNLPAVVDGILKAMTAARQEEVQAWNLELEHCEHVSFLVQDEKAGKEIDLTKCADCDLKENLWMCLQCGNLGCGRAQFGGVGGNSHGVAHFSATKHPASVKLGSISPEGTADIYCYICNDERLDPHITEHLRHWGINIAERQKTEKSLTEMQIEQNLLWEFRMTGEDGKELSPLFGPGLTGLKNLGNSCYLASILQCLFSLDGFKVRYGLIDDVATVNRPAEDLDTQLKKVGDGLLSGRYSKPEESQPSTEEHTYVNYQRGLAPAMLKALVGKGHEEFSTMRQQDAFELLLHLFKLITRTDHPAPLKDPVSDFRFAVEQRLQCLGCKKVRYRTDEQDNITVPVPARKLKDVVMGDDDQKKEEYEPVTLKECLDIFTGVETIEYSCKACGSKEGANKKIGFKTFPQVLAVNARRFALINWVPTKLDIPVVVDTAPFPLDPYMSTGPLDTEELLPEDADEGGSKASFVANAGAMAQLEGMGFPTARCEKALYHTGNADAEAAMNWLFQHMEDADIDAPLELPGASGSASGGAAADPESVVMLTSMGFTEAQAKKALRETGGNVERAVEWVFSHPDDAGDDDSAAAAATGPSKEKAIPGSSETPANFQLSSIVCHKGSSIHAGHYVAFIRKLVDHNDGMGPRETWVLFNDEKVVEGADVEEMKKFANGIRFSISTLHPLTARVLPTLFNDRAGISLYDVQYSTQSSSQVRSPIPEATITQIVSALQRFKNVCDTYSVPAANIRAVATEATRTAPNSEEFRNAIYEAVGWRIELLSKEDEGHVGALGIASSFATVEGLVMDLGGGSTQLSWMMTRRGIVRCADQAVSLPFGAAALLKKLSTAINSEAIEAIARTIREEISKAVASLNIPKELEDSAARNGGYTLYLSGGGFRGFGYLLLAGHEISPYPLPIINGFSAPRETFARLAESIGLELTGPQHEELADRFRISNRRAEQVPAVAFLVRNLLQSLPTLKDVVFCQGGVREGCLYYNLDVATRAQNPLVVATAVFAPPGASKLVRLIGDALPKSTPEVFWIEVVPALANLLTYHAGVPREGRASTGLHFTTTGHLGGTHGLTHRERVLLALCLCARWGGEVAEGANGFRGRLERIVGAENAWWARYVGAVAQAVGAVFPAGILPEEGEPPDHDHDHAGDQRRKRRLSDVDGTISFFARDVERKGNLDIVLRVRVAKDDPDTSAVMVRKTIEDVEKVGKRKHCKDLGFRRKVAVIWETTSIEARLA
ncbi:Ubiquitin carboxyl-terminal hydrolase [Drechslerella dactyloides]|uniref:Ubiquitin carboxyl-terminal hydrolase 14 n=1 Tax=Drechslerella dactyloides TaxID=74499 RepID=A0AAD6NJM2_DREDA|nr:Ubiquitin carboxyl-terminal hydrolase [Drechslerella dactyloides]